MPHLRFTRDRRGYQNTFLVHRERSRGRERSSILYWFRTPPDIRVGRAALDEIAIRELEQTHPQIRFDWPQILDVRTPLETAEAESKPSGRGGMRAPREIREPPARPAETAVSAAAVVEDLDAAGNQDTEQDAGEVKSPLEDGAFPDESSPRLTAAQRTFDAESLGRLRARYSEVLARLSSESLDAGRAEELRQLAERLNPDAWVTDDDVRAGLEGFEQTLETLRTSLGPLFRRSRDNNRRRRRRGKPGVAPAGTPGNGPQ